MRLAFAYALSSARRALSFLSPPGQLLLTFQDSDQRIFLPSLQVISGSELPPHLG